MYKSISRERLQLVNNYTQHHVKKIASKSLLAKVLADFLFRFYLLNKLLETRNKAYEEFTKH
jgi:hypothetical protein